MSDLPKRLRASVGIDAINGDSFERGICGQQMMEAAKVIEELESRVRHLEDEVHDLKAEYQQPDLDVMFELNG